MREGVVTMKFAGIPIYAPEKVNETKPDYVFMLLWNIKDKIVRQLVEVKS